MGNIVAEITFDQRHAFGSFEQAVTRAAGRNYSGSGTLLGSNPVRDLSAAFDTFEEADAFVERAKSIAESARVDIRVSVGDLRY